MEGRPHLRDGPHWRAPDPDKAGHKLLEIRDETGKQKVLVRLIAKGRWEPDPVQQRSERGFSVFALRRGGRIGCTHVGTVEDAVKKSLDL